MKKRYLTFALLVEDRTLLRCNPVGSRETQLSPVKLDYVPRLQRVVRCIHHNDAYTVITSKFELLLTSMPSHNCAHCDPITTSTIKPKVKERDLQHDSELNTVAKIHFDQAAAKGRTRTLPPRKALTRRTDISVAVPRRAGLVEKTNSQANIITEKGKTGKPLKEIKPAKEASKKVVAKKVAPAVIPTKKVSVATATKSITTEVIVSGDDIIAVTKKKESTSVKVSGSIDETAASDKENEDPDCKKQEAGESERVSDKDVELTKKATLEAAKENLTSTKDVNKEKANTKEKKPVRKILGENTTILNAGTTQTEKETRTAAPVKIAKKTPLAEATPFVEQSEKKDFTIAEKIEPTSKRVKMEFIDLDSEDIGDPVMVYEYVEEIVGYWRKLEVCKMIG